VHTTSSTGSRPLDFADLAREPVATLGLVTQAGLQGFGPSLTQALVGALAEASPSVRARSVLDTVNAISEHGLAAEYADLLAGFARTGILERDRLHKIGSALGSRYVLLPGLAEFDHVLIDRFEISGLKLVRNRVTTLRLWLQVWDARSGRLVAESTGESTVASELLRPDRSIPLDDTAQKLWLRMIREGVLARRPR
jgi:hypothetical protein